VRQPTKENSLCKHSPLQANIMSRKNGVAIADSRKVFGRCVLGEGGMVLGTDFSRSHGAN